MIKKSTMNSSQAALNFLGILVAVFGLGAITRAQTPAPQPGQEYDGVAIARSEAAAGVLAARVAVRESVVVRPVSPLLFGFNHNWHQSENVVFGPTSREITPDYLEAVRGLPMPLNRMSGTESQYFRWKLAVGPLDQRTPQKPHAGGIPLWRLGPLEWVQATWRIDPTAEFAWVLNMWKETPGDHADLARLFTAGPDDEWGRHRFAAGIERPVPVRIWELGNELDWGEFREDFPLDRYIAECRKAIAAVRSVIPDARFAAHALTAPWSPRALELPGGWRTWHRTVLRELGPDLDYIVLHPYYHGSPVPEVERFIQALTDDILEVTKSDRIKLFISEHAAWPPRPTEPGKKWQDTWHLTHGLHGCLATAEFLNRLLSRPQVGAAAYHSFSAGPWGVVYRDGKTGRDYHTGIYDLFRLYGEALGQEVIASEVSGPRADVLQTDLTFTAVAMRTAEGVNLVLVNREPSAVREVSFAFERGYDLVETHSLTAETMESHHTATTKDMQTSREQHAPAGELFREYRLRAKSIVVLKLRAR